MARPFLSVLLPTYNGGAFLRDALDSVLRQDARDSLEIIAVDDGSTDGSVSILQEFGRSLCVRTIEKGHTGNWVANTNEALRCARGTFVCFLHQDDRWADGRVERLRQAARDFPDAGVLLGHARFIDERGNALNRWSCPLPEGRLLEPADWALPLFVQNFIAIPAPAVRLEAALDAAPLDESLRYTADWKFWLGLATRNRAVVLPHVLADFRVHGASQTIAYSRDVDSFKRQMEVVHEEFVPFVEGSGQAKGPWIRASRCSIESNCWLAAVAGRQKPDHRAMLHAIRGLGLRGIRPYWRYSRVFERCAARVRCQSGRFSSQ